MQAMNPVLLPKEIKELLDKLFDRDQKDYDYALIAQTSGIYHGDLTYELTSVDCADFIVRDSTEGLWLFSANDQTGGWNVSPIGAPAYRFHHSLIDCGEKEGRFVFDKLKEVYPSVRFIYADRCVKTDFEEFADSKFIDYAGMILDDSEDFEEKDDFFVLSQKRVIDR